jgi:hypothetical protein
MRENSAGIGLVFGSAVGTLIFALTGWVLWVGIGAGLGLVIGAAVGGRQSGGGEGSDSTRQNG